MSQECGYKVIDFLLQTKTLKEVKKIYAENLLKNNEFEKSFILFADIQEDPRYLLSLFPVEISGEYYDSNKAIKGFLKLIFR